MAQLVGPDENTRLGYRLVGGRLNSTAGLTATIYTDAAGTVLAAINVYDGTATPGALIAGSTLTVGTDSKVPLFWFPDSVDTLYAKVGTGPVGRIDADYDRRIGVAGGIAGLDALRTVPSENVPTLWSPRRKPSRPTPTYWDDLQTGHGWTVAGQSASNLNDTSLYYRGTQCATVTTGGAAVQSRLRKTGITAINMTGKQAWVTVRVGSVTNLDKLAFYLALDSGFANFYLWTFHTHPTNGSTPYIRSGEWVTVPITWADVQSGSGTCTVTAGVADTKTGFTAMQVACYDNAASTVTWHLGSVEIMPDSSTSLPNGAVVLTFDDIHSSQDLARQAMEPYRYRGVQHVIADKADTSGRLTTQQLRDLQDQGWEVSGHSFTTAAHDAGYESLTALQAQYEFRNLRNWLRRNGFNGSNFAYPNGRFGLTSDGIGVDRIAAEEGWSTGRTIINETKAGLYQPMPLRVHALSGVSSVGTTVASLTASGGWLDRVKGNGEAGVLCLHKIVAGTATTSTEISQADLSTLLAAINSRGIPVLTMDDLLAYYN